MERQKKEAGRVDLATDTEYWFCVCFETREQKTEFLQSSGLGDGDERFINGFNLAKKMGVNIKAERAKFSVPRDDSLWSRELDLI
jgi:hypothetical protein